MDGSSLLWNPCKYNPVLVPTGFDEKFKELLPRWSLVLILLPDVIRDVNLPRISFGFTTASELSAPVIIIILRQYQHTHSLGSFSFAFWNLDHQWVDPETSIEWTKPLIITYIPNISECRSLIFSHLRPYPMVTLQVVVVLKNVASELNQIGSISFKKTPKHRLAMIALRKPNTNTVKDLQAKGVLNISLFQKQANVLTKSPVSSWIYMLDKFGFATVVQWPVNN